MLTSQLICGVSFYIVILLARISASIQVFKHSFGKGSVSLREM